MKSIRNEQFSKHNIIIRISSKQEINQFAIYVAQNSYPRICGKAFYFKLNPNCSWLLGSVLKSCTKQCGSSITAP